MIDMCTSHALLKMLILSGSIVNGFEVMRLFPPGSSLLLCIEGLVLCITAFKTGLFFFPCKGEFSDSEHICINL